MVEGREIKRSRVGVQALGPGDIEADAVLVEGEAADAARTGGGAADAALTDGGAADTLRWDAPEDVDPYPLRCGGW